MNARIARKIVKQYSRSGVPFGRLAIARRRFDRWLWRGLRRIYQPEQRAGAHQFTFGSC